MHKRIIILSVSVLCLAGTPLFSQVPELIKDQDFRDAAQASVDSIYNMNFDESRELLEPWRTEYPDHPLWTLMKGMRFWWKVLSDLENTSYDEQFYQIMAEADFEAARLLRKKKDHADALIVKAVSNGYISRLYANRGEWISSVNRSRKAISAYQYLREVQPNLPDLKLGEGIKLYYSAYIPEAYPIVKSVSWALPGGDKEKGLRLIKEAADSAIFARAESIYFLGNIFYNYENDYGRAVTYLEKLYREYPKNNYFIGILVKTYYNLKNYNSALKVIERSLDRWNSENLPFEMVLKEQLYTYKGRIYNRKGDKEQARDAFANAFEAGQQLSNSSERSLHVISGYYAGKLYYETGNAKQAERYLTAVQDMSSQPEYRERAGDLLDKIRSESSQ